MEDLSGGASAPAEGNVASANEPVSTPNPISTDPRPAEPEKKEPEAKSVEKKDEKKPVSTRDALKNAASKVNDREKAAQAEKPAAKELATKVETAAQKPAEAAKPGEGAKPVQSSHRDAPSRFSNDAKAAWETAPEAIKAETHRAIRELEEGHAKYKADAEAFNEYREFDRLAKSVGTTGKAAAENYIGIERLLMQNPVAGFQRIAQNMNLDIRQVAAAILGQNPLQAASQQDQTIRELRAEIAQMKQAVSGATSYIQNQQTTSVENEVIEFAKTHPRVDELADDIAFFLQTKKAKNLDEAYQMADRLNPAPSVSPAVSPAAQEDLSAQTRKGGKSVSGAPTGGSNPTLRKPSTSIKDSLRRAVAQAG